MFFYSWDAYKKSGLIIGPKYQRWKTFYLSIEFLHHILIILFGFQKLPFDFIDFFGKFDLDIITIC